MMFLQLMDRLFIFIAGYKIVEIILGTPNGINFNFLTFTIFFIIQLEKFFGIIGCCIFVPIVSFHSSFAKNWALLKLK